MSSGAPDVRSTHYLQHLGYVGGSLRKFSPNKNHRFGILPRNAAESRSRAAGRSQGNRAYAFRMTLVAQGKLPQIIIIIIIIITVIIANIIINY